MIPKLYQKDGTTLIGTLTNCIKCLVEEERNGIFEVTLQYPNNETISTSLVYDNIIICDSNDTLKNQKFRIYDTRRMMNNTIEVYARHISFDLAYDHIDSIDITNQSCEYALNTIFRNTQFSTSYVGHSDIINAQNYKIANCNALEAIAGKQGSIIDTYGTGAEILRDNIDIYVYNKRGNDNGVSIEYAKNLTGFELQENTDDLITRIIPFATYTPEGGTQTRVDGPTCNSQYISNYSHPFIAEIDFSDKFKNNEVPTANKLQTLAEQYFNNNKCDLPKQNWKIEFIPLSKCVGYEGIEDAISLCDTVTIKDTRYNIDTKAKVIKTVYDVLRERYDSMELGEPRTTLGDIVNTGNEKGEQGPPGPQGPKGEDGNIGDFPDSLPSKPTLTATLLGFASIQLDWTYENKPYYWYEVYANKEKNFTPNVFDIVHKGQTSSFLYQAKPGETWYFRVCAVNSYGHRTAFSDQVKVVTTLVDNLENYFTTAAIGQAVVGSLTADYMTAFIIKGHWIDAKNLSVTDGNGKRTLDIDSFGNVNLDVTSLKIASKDVATIENLSSNLTNSSIQYYLSTSQTSLAGGSWQDTAPTWTQGKYMWQRMKYTTYKGTVSYGTAICIAGAKGDTGEQGPSGTDGRGLVSSTPQWYLSTSNTTQTGGSWQNTMPALEEKKYLWTRFKNVWENPTATTYTTPVLEQIVESLKGVSTRVKTVEQTLTQDGITTIVGDYYADGETTRNAISTIEQNANNISQKVEQVIESNGVNLIPNPTASVSLGEWSSAGTSTAYVIRYASDYEYTPPTTTNTTPIIKDDDLYANAEIHCIEPTGGGLAMVIRDCSGKVIVIDGGYEGNAQNVISYMTNLGITHINYYIVTHSHSDHIQAGPSILDRFTCDYAIIKESNWSKLPPIEIEWGTENYYNAFINKCKENEVTILDPRIDTYIKLSEHSNIKIFNSDSDNYTDYNYQSLMLLYTYKDNKAFFAGDSIADTAIAPLGQVGTVGFLQAGHHGDGRGSNAQDGRLIDELKPKYTYFASDFLAKFLKNGTDDIKVSETFKRVSWHYGESFSHGTNLDGNIKFTMDGTNITTTGTPARATNLWYEREPGMWFFFKSTGYLAQSEWLEIDGYTYYFGDDYLMYRNKWKQDTAGAWFWFKDDGKMAVNESIVIDGKTYNFDHNGACTNPDI